MIDPENAQEREFGPQWTSEQKPSASGTKTLGRTHDCALLGKPQFQSLGTIPPKSEHRQGL